MRGAMTLPDRYSARQIKIAGLIRSMDWRAAAIPAPFIDLPERADGRRPDAPEGCRAASG